MTMLEVVLSVYAVWATAGCVVMWLDARMFRNAHATVHAALAEAQKRLASAGREVHGIRVTMEENLRRRESGRTK